MSVADSRPTSGIQQHRLQVELLHHLEYEMPQSRVGMPRTHLFRYDIMKSARRTAIECHFISQVDDRGHTHHATLKLRLAMIIYHNLKRLPSQGLPCLDFLV